MQQSRTASVTLWNSLEQLPSHYESVLSLSSCFMLLGLSKVSINTLSFPLCSLCPSGAPISSSYFHLFSLFYGKFLFLFFWFFHWLPNFSSQTLRERKMWRTEIQPMLAFVKGGKGRAGDSTNIHGLIDWSVLSLLRLRIKIFYVFNMCLYFILETYLTVGATRVSFSPSLSPFSPVYSPFSCCCPGLNLGPCAI